MQTFETFAEPVQKEHVADADITTAIELLFLTKRGVTSHLLDVITNEGIVELTGFTDNLLSRHRAEEIALAVRGVRGVVNELLIRTPDVPDAELLRDVEQALADDATTADYNVACTVAEGVVSPAGTVQSWVEKQLVLRVLQSVRGVRRIVADHLVLRGGPLLNSDEEITTQIEELLDWNFRVNSALVEVRTTDRVVHLSGTVGTAAERDGVVATAYQAGATRVDARDLFVAYWALGRQLRRDKHTPRTDEDIVKAVRDTFRYDPRVLSFEPLVQSRDGVVTLAGTVSNLRAKQEAERDARNVVGVWDVHNLLKVRPRQPQPDDDVRRRIVGALGRSPYVGHHEFQVEVRNGKAWLAGEVHDHFEQEHAADVAAGVGGVLEVDSRVVVPGGPAHSGPPAPGGAAPHPAGGPVSDHALAGRIRLRYFWSASLYNQEVEVQVENGRATLTGTVDTWQEREQAATDAHEAGARDVNNHLHVATAPLARRRMAMPATTHQKDMVISL